VQARSVLFLLFRLFLRLLLLLLFLFLFSSFPVVPLAAASEP